MLSSKGSFYQSLKIQGVFIPCTIGNSIFNKVLCDFGASVNIIYFSAFKKLGLGEVKPTILHLKLSNQSIIYPIGLAKNLLIKIDEFIFPVGFIVLDMEEKMIRFH